MRSAGCLPSFPVILASPCEGGSCQPEGRGKLNQIDKRSIGEASGIRKAATVSARDEYSKCQGLIQQMTEMNTANERNDIEKT